MMVSSYLLRSVIEHEFMERVGKFQVRQDEPKAMMVSFSTGVQKGEEGYRYFDILIYAPQNYVTVWTRKRWNVISEEHLEYDEDSEDMVIKKGFDYVEGASPWTKIADHDSGWREGINDALKDGGDLSTFSPVDHRGWYSIVDPRKYLDETLIARDGFLIRKAG